MPLGLVGAVLTTLVFVLTPVTYRVIFGGPRRASHDWMVDEATGGLLAMAIMTPVGLLIGLVTSSILVLARISLDDNLLWLLLGDGLVSGVLGGYAWIRLLLKPVGSTKTSPKAGS